MAYISHHIPKVIRGKNNINYIVNELHKILNKNKISKNFIGKGYYNSIMPPFINHTFLKNPKWYTSYTPYQPEISQGRLEMLSNYQTMITELTDMDIANASLLDECNAACESINMAFNYYRGKKKKILVHNELHPQVINSLKLKMDCMNVNPKYFTNIEELNEIDIKNSFAIIIQNPSTKGNLINLEKYDMNDIIKICGTDPLSLFLIKPASNFDIVYGSTNRFGLGLSYGGPHSGYLSCKRELVRFLPGRIVTTGYDKYGEEGFRLGLQSREQHIKKEKALSNICTAQSLPAILSTAYMMYHGKKGMINIANNVNSIAMLINSSLDSDFQLINENYFDTITIKGDNSYTTNTIAAHYNRHGIEFFEDNGELTFSFDETHLDINILTNYFVEDKKDITKSIPNNFLRDDNFLNQNIFSGLSELELTRYFHQLSDKDYSLVNGMIPLGSCTMKHTTPWSMSLLDNPNLNIHPYSNSENTKGYNEMFIDLTKRLSDLIGLPHWFYQSQSGAMGEFAALYTFKKFFNNERNIILIPDNAHGTNFASASICGFDIKKIQTTNGEINLEKLNLIIEKEKDNIAGIMITYPSTFGLFDENIGKVIEKVKDIGAKVYLDGANMNALVGNMKLSDLGVDACHLNLHKTFSIPHGGGGPGMGPIGVTDELKPYLPKDPLEGPCISGSKYGSGSLCTITWSYLNLLEDDIKICTDYAIKNSNYIKDNLKNTFNIVFTENKECTHEFLIDVSALSKKGINESHIAKRLMDYGFHAPTMSWPLPNVLMIEPTESESKEEMDRFIEAMKSIYQETQDYKIKDSPLINAPHTERDLIEWDYPYSIEIGCFPAGHKNKYWPKINKLDDAGSDRKLLKL